MRRKILALSLVLAMAASVLSPAAMAQTVSDSLPIVSVTSESASAAESESTAESVSTADSANAAESTSAAESVSTAESTSTAESVSTPASAPAAENTTAAQPQADEVAIDETNFPDANFREVVKRFDKDGNGSFSQAELDAVKGLSPFNEGIQNLKGIEYFTALKYLDVGSNQLTTLDVSANTALTELEASGNQLTSLDVSANTALTNLSVKYNQLTSLDVSGCTMLTNLDVESNKLTTLDVSTNTALSRLSVRENQLTNLDISANTALINLNLSTNKLTKLDLSANTALTSLNVYNNQLTELDLSANTALTSLNVSGNQLTALNVSANTKLTDLYVENNQLTELDVSANTVLTNLGVSYNQLTSLDLSANEQLFQLSAKGTSLTALRLGNLMTWDLFDVDNPTKVSLTAETGTAIDLKTYAPFFDASKVSNVKGGTIDANGILTGWTSGSPVTYTYDAGFEQVLNVEITVQDEAQTTEVAIDETNFPDANFREFVKQYDTDKNGSFSQAELDAVTVINAPSYRGIQNLKGIECFTALASLNVYYNQLSELDVSANTALESLHVSHNQLSELDVSANTVLTSLDVSDNQLTSLDVSANTALTSLNVSYNQLSELDVSANTELWNLEVGSNQLTSLDVSANTELWNLHVSANQLTSLYVSANTELLSLDVGGNQLTSLDVSANTALESLNVSESQLTSLDVSANTALQDLYVNNNQLTELDVSANTELWNLHVDNNQLTALDVSANTALTSLNVSYNQLTELDVSANTALASLDVNHNQLSELDVSANTALQVLYVANNQLTALDVSANTKLSTLIVNQNQLISLKLGNKPSWEYTVDNPTQLSLTAKAGTPIDLKTYAPFFDASKVSNVQGGAIDANGVLTGWTSGSPVTYTYDAGFEQVLNVSIVIVDEDLKGLSLVANPFSKTYNGKAVTEQELIAGAKATYDGKEVSGKWSVENLPEIKDVGTYRPVLTFTPDSAEYVGGTIETSVQINPAPFSVWVGLSNYNINTGDKLPTISLQYGGTPNGEVLESTVEPVFTGMPETATAGRYTIVLSNAKEVLESLKAQPTAKNYTIQLWDKASLFISRYIQLPNAPASPVDGTTGRLLMEKTFTNVPESLKAVGLDSVEKVTDKLLANVTGTTKDNTVVYDVHYSISADGQTWNALTPEQFPKEGLTITLPYPEGVDTKANDFTAMHMFTQDVNGFKTGDVEVIKAVKTDAGLQMTVKGFSPIAITWAKAGTTPPTDGGNGGNVVTPPTGGNGTTTQPTTPNPGTGAIAQTGDNSAVAVWGIVMALCATAAAGLMIMKSKGKKKQ